MIVARFCSIYSLKESGALPIVPLHPLISKFTLQLNNGTRRVNVCKDLNFSLPFPNTARLPKVLNFLKLWWTWQPQPQWCFWWCANRKFKNYYQESYDTIMGSACGGRYNYWISMWCIFSSYADSLRIIYMLDWGDSNVSVDIRRYGLIVIRTAP